MSLADSPSHAGSVIVGSANTIPENVGSAKECWFSEKDFKSTKRCSKYEKTGAPHWFCNESRIAKSHCHLAGNFRELTHNHCKLNTRENHCSFIARLFHKFFGYHSHLNFEKLIIEATGEVVKVNEVDVIAKSSQKNLSVKMGCLKSLDSYGFSDASLDKSSTLLTCFPLPDASGM